MSKFWNAALADILDTSKILDRGEILDTGELLEREEEDTGTHFYDMRTGEYIGHRKTASKELKILDSKINLIKYHPQDTVCFTSINPSTRNSSSIKNEYMDYVLEHYHSDFEGVRDIRIKHSAFLKKIVYLYGESGGGLADWYAWTHNKHIDGEKPLKNVGHRYSDRAEKKINGSRKSYSYTKIREYLENGLSTNSSYAEYMRQNIQELNLACYRALNNYSSYIPVGFQLSSPKNWLGWFQSIDSGRRRTTSKATVFLTEIMGNPFKSTSDFIGRMEIPEGKGVSCSIFYSYDQKANLGELSTCPIYFCSTSGKKLQAEIPQGVEALTWWLSLPHSYHQSLFDFYKKNSF